MMFWTHQDSAGDSASGSGKNPNWDRLGLGA
jgi:hypothetical protein